MPFPRGDKQQKEIDDFLKSLPTTGPISTNLIQSIKSNRVSYTLSEPVPVVLN